MEYKSIVFTQPRQLSRQSWQTSASFRLARSLAALLHGLPASASKIEAESNRPHRIPVFRDSLHRRLRARSLAGNPAHRSRKMHKIGLGVGRRSVRSGAHVQRRTTRRRGRHWRPEVRTGMPARTGSYKSSVHGPTGANERISNGSPTRRKPPPTLKRKFSKRVETTTPGPSHCVGPDNAQLCRRAWAQEPRPPPSDTAILTGMAKAHTPALS